ncbi:hypothetical protein AB0J90_13605 [Micromonospora sp. NPDC049523]|uniref:hypothetical protein n=1 Tax=Micromonospora sp. NPDC049523 TaxID=3155921 RepID=UPI00344A44D4
MPDITTIPTGTPIALLPYRIETRYVPGATVGPDGQPIPRPGSDLLVRIYPDQIHFDAHEPGLTQVEKQARDEFVATGGHGPDPDAPEVVTAWARLVEQFGETRAAWIARRLAEGESLGERPAAWSEPVRARILPDRFVVLGYRFDRLVFQRETSVVPRTLAVSPPPDQHVTPPPPPGPDASGHLPDGFAVPPGMGWMIDPAEGAANGMLLRIPLGPDQLQLDRLVVLGVRVETRAGEPGVADPTRGAADLAALLAAHRFTDGLALLAQGTPTNNTDRARSGLGEPGLAATTSRRELKPDRVTGGDGSDGARLAAALGVPTTVFGKAEGAAGRESRDAQAMNAALWPATWGYLLDRFLTDVGHTGLEPYRRHFVDWVRGRGPLAALRIGNQPYGVLPVVSLLRYQADPADPVGARVADLIRRVRQRWLSSAVGPGRTPVLETLRRRPVSDGYAVRGVYSSIDWLGTAISFEGLDQAQIGYRVEQARIEGLAYQDPSAPSRTRFNDIGAFTSASSWPGALPMVAADLTAEQVDWLAGLRARMLATLPTEIEAGGWPAKPADSVLYLLLRHAARLVATGPAPDVRDYRPRGNFGDAPDPPPLDRYAELVAALDDLAKRPARVVDLAARETLDLAGFRIDAWGTSVASRRLARLRGNPQAGLVLGGYGFVENLAPGGRDVPVPADQTPSGETPGLVRRDSNAGYLQAPSVAHAATAAVLRAGHLNHAQDSDGTGTTPFALDLSSRRVRLGTAVVDGLRQGQTLAALIGYRIERALHDTGQAGAVLTIRRTVAELAGRGSEQEVVDGVALLTEHTAGRVPWGSAGLPTLAAVRPAIEVARESLDAVGDLSVAEGLHHTLQGNYQRASAALAIGKVDGVVPPELEVIRTPRTGAGITHRVLLMLDAPALGGDPDGWLAGPRETAEPALAGWVAAVLGAPDRVVADIDLRDPATGDALVPATRVAVRDALPYPLELLAYADDPAGIEARLASYHLDPARRPAGVGPDARLRVLPDPASPLAPGRIYLTDLLAVLRSIATALTTARPLAGPDLAPNSAAEDDPAGVLVDELRQRAQVAHLGLTNLRAALDAAIGDRTAEEPVDLAAAAAHLLTATAFGIPGVVPVARHALDATDPDGRPAKDLIAAATATLTNQALAGHAEVRRRAAAADAIAARATRADDWVDLLRAVFGEGFLVVPRFTPVEPAVVGRAFTGTSVAPAPAGQEPLAWFARMARIRPAVAAIESVGRFSQALATRPGLDLAIGQVPAPAAGEPARRWVGLPPLDPSGAVPTGVTSLVVVGAGPAGTGSLAGLLLDEWGEVVPARRETTAVAYHYDAPGAQAPQAVLLAVSPRPAGGNWTLDDLIATVNETIDMVKARSSDRVDLGAGHLLGSLAYLPLWPASEPGAVDVARVAPVPADFGVPHTAGQPWIGTFNAEHSGAPFTAIRQGRTVRIKVIGRNLQSPVQDSRWSATDPALRIQVVGQDLTTATLDLTAGTYPAYPAVGEQKLRLTNRGGWVEQAITVTPRIGITRVAPTVLTQDQYVTEVELQVEGHELVPPTDGNERREFVFTVPNSPITVVAVRHLEPPGRMGVRVRIPANPKPPIEYDHRGRPIKKVKTYTSSQLDLAVQGPLDPGEPAAAAFYRLAQALTYEALHWTEAL